MNTVNTFSRSEVAMVLSLLELLPYGSCVLRS